jgi:aspartate aminotransferase
MTVPSSNAGETAALTPRFSTRSRRVGASATQRVAQEADRMKRAGIDVVDLGAGEPDFPTPAHIKQAGVAAIEQNFTKYTPNAGIPELKAAICQRYSDAYDVRFDPANTIVSAGGKQALYNVAMAVLSPGDEVVTHAPGWPTITDQVLLADATPVVVRTHPEDGFRVHARTLLDAVTPRTTAIVINSPGNPTGGLIDETDLEIVAREAAAKSIWVVIDLCYEQLIYDDVSHNLPRVLQDAAPNHGVVVGSLSKSYAMTGWRCGWAVGPAPLIAACNSIQSHCTSNVSSITQRAGVAALNGSHGCVREMREEYRGRRDAVLEWLGAEPRVQCTCPAGAFYLFPDISAFLSPDTIRTSADFATALLAHGHVAVTPGEAFDAPGFLRMSYAASRDRLREGIDRLLAFVRRLERGDFD